MGFRRRFAALAIAGLLAHPVHAQAVRTGPQYRDFNAPVVDGAPAELGCIAFDQARPTYNPVDLYKAARACIADHRHADAVPLFTLAEIDGRYDALRVIDPTVRGAAQAARTTTFAAVAESDYAAFSTAARKALDPAALPALCAAMRRVGPPAYHPRYMLGTTRAGLTGISGDGLVPGFDRDAGWRKALDSYLHCPA